MCWDEMVDDVRTVFAKHAKCYRTSPEYIDREALSGLVYMANPGPQSLVLDVATGAGHTALSFAPFVRQVVGIDITPEMLSEAMVLTRHDLVHNLDLCMADVMAMPFPDSTFDLVSCRQAAHHFPDISGAMKEMVRVLKPGGILAIDDRSVPEDPDVVEAMNGLDLLRDHSHVRVYRPKEWNDMVSAAGLEPRQMRTYMRNLPLLRMTATVDGPEAEKVVRTVGELDEGMKVKFGYRTVSGEVHINHWFVMLTAVKPVTPSS